MNSRLIAFFVKFSRIIHPKILTRFHGLRENLAKASIKTGFTVYVGLMIFSSIAAGVGAFTVSAFLLLFLKFGATQIFSLAALIGVLSALFSMGICYLYPKYVAYSRGNKIDANLPIIANFMSVLASAGMPPEAIFRSLARVGKEFSVDKEANSIIGEIEFLGVDLHTALKRAAERSTSRQFSGLLNGIITTSHMGGDLASYLRDEAEKFKRARMLKLRRFLDNLAVIAEIYITFMVAAPLVLIVMLSVMAFIGGGVTIGNMDVEILLDLLTFVLMPAGICVMILAVDSMTPLR